MHQEFVRALLRIFVACGVAMTASAAAAEAPRTIFLIRHAEKGSGDDPSLTPQGRERAEALVRTLRDARIAEIFVSEWTRTQETAAPLARALGLEARIARGDVPAQLRALPPGSRALVVSHSNLVPEIAAQLGCEPIAPLAESEYERLYVMTLTSVGACELLYLHYGTQ